MDIQLVWDMVEKLSIIALLLLIIITGSRGDWVFRRYYEAERKEKESYRTALNKALALLDAAIGKEGRKA